MEDSEYKHTGITANLFPYTQKYGSFVIDLDVEGDSQICVLCRVNDTTKRARPINPEANGNGEFAICGRCIVDLGIPQQGKERIYYLA